MAPAGETIPYGKINESEQLGMVVRRKRRQAGLTQIRAAGLAGVGVRFLSELERGKPTIELGKVLRVLSRLGLEVWVLPRGQEPDARRGADRG